METKKNIACHVIHGLKHQVLNTCNRFFFSLHSSAGPGLTGSGSHGLLAPVHPIWDGHIPWLTTMLALGSGENLPEPSPAGMALGAVNSQEWSWWQLLQGWNCKSNINKMTPKKTYVTLYSPWQHLVAHPSPAKKENAIHTEMQSLYHKILSWLPLAFMAGLPFSAFMAVVAFMPFMAFMALATI